MSEELQETTFKSSNTMKPSVNALELQADKNEIKKSETLPNPKIIKIEDIVDKWFQYRYFGVVKRRSFHLAFIYHDFLYLIGGTDILEGKTSDINRLKLSNTELHRWELIKPSFALEKIAYSAGVLCKGDYYIIGGQNEGLNSIKRILKYRIDENLLENVVIENNEMPPINSHTACISEEKIYIFAGNSNDQKLNDVFVFDIENKSVVNVTKDLDVKPIHRNDHSAAIVGNAMYIHGGMSINEEYLDDLWKFSLNNNKWNQIKLTITNSPKGRIGHSLIVNGDKIYLFGGMTKIIRETNELWYLNTMEENKGFLQIHDNIIEIEEAVNEEYFDEKGQSSRKQKKKFRLLNHYEVEKRTNPNFWSQYDSRKPIPPTLDDAKKGLQPLITSTAQFERTLFINSELKKKANVAKMKNSNIFTINRAEANTINEKLKEVNKANIPEDILLFKGVPPTPRNGMSTLLFGTKLLVFGGDRNKMAYNDIYCFETDFLN